MPVNWRRKPAAGTGLDAAAHRGGAFIFGAALKSAVSPQSDAICRHYSCVAHLLLEKLPGLFQRPQNPKRGTAADKMRIHRFALSSLLLLGTLVLAVNAYRVVSTITCPLVGF